MIVAWLVKEFCHSVFTRAHRISASQTRWLQAARSPFPTTLGTACSLYRQEHNPPGSCIILTVVWIYPLKVDSPLCTLFYTTVNEPISFLRVLLHNQMHKERKSCCSARLSITCTIQPLHIFLPLLSTRNSCNFVREYPCNNKSMSITFC